MAASSKANTNANTSSNSSFSIIQSLIMLPSVTTAAPKQLATSTDATSTAQSFANTVAIPTFKFEDFIENSLKINLKKPDNVEICQYYLKNQCRLGRHNHQYVAKEMGILTIYLDHIGARCAYKHPSKTKLVVYKHWLRGLCKKGMLAESVYHRHLLTLYLSKS